MDLISIVSAADGNHKVNFTGFVEFLPKFQRAGLPIDYNGNGWAQPLTVTETLFNAGIKPV